MLDTIHIMFLLDLSAVMEDKKGNMILSEGDKNRM